MGSCLRRVCDSRGKAADASSKTAEPRRRGKSSSMGQTFHKDKLSSTQVRRLQRQVSFKEAEIRYWYEEFVHSLNRSHHDVCLTREEFTKTYNSVFPGECEDFAAHVFRTFDLNGDNKVDFREFLIGMSRSGSEDVHKRLAWAFQVYDVKGTGYITLENMIQIVRAVFKKMGPRVSVHGDVLVTPESMAYDLFSQMAPRGERRVSWPQFHDSVLRNPTAMNLLQCSPPDSAQDVAQDDDDEVSYR